MRRGVWIKEHFSIKKMIINNDVIYFKIEYSFKILINVLILDHFIKSTKKVFYVKIFTFIYFLPNYKKISLFLIIIFFFGFT
jgi:hypothetical protein